jgi:hypothetical protein
MNWAMTGVSSYRGTMGNAGICVHLLRMINGSTRSSNTGGHDGGVDAGDYNASTGIAGTPNVKS